MYGLPGGRIVKNTPANAGDAGSIPGSGRSPGVGNGNLLQYSWLQSPWREEPGGLQSTGGKELDTTKCPRTHTRVSVHPSAGVEQHRSLSLWRITELV